MKHKAVDLQGYIYRLTCMPLWKNSFQLKLFPECHLAQVIEQELKESSQYRNIWKELTLWAVWLLAMKRMINYTTHALYKKEL